MCNVYSSTDLIYEALQKGPLKDKIQIRYYMNPNTARIETINDHNVIVNQSPDYTYYISFSNWCEELGIPFADVWDKTSTVTNYSSLTLATVINLIKINANRKDVEL